MVLELLVVPLNTEQSEIAVLVRYAAWVVMPLRIQNLAKLLEEQRNSDGVKIDTCAVIIFVVEHLSAYGTQAKSNEGVVVGHHYNGTAWSQNLWNGIYCQEHRAETKGYVKDVHGFFCQTDKIACL